MTIAISVRDIPGSQESHDRLVASICDYLALSRVPHSRVNQRPVMTIRGWRCQGADEGFPDIVACLRGGRAWLIEAKSGKAVMSNVQKRVRAEWEKAGALYTLARSVADVAIEVKR